MKYEKIIGSRLDRDYILIKGVFYRLEKMDDEEIVEAVCNKGDALPLIPEALRTLPDVNE